MGKRYATRRFSFLRRSIKSSSYEETILLTLAAVLLSSCGSTSTLYYWGGNQGGTSAYENLAYQSYKKQTPKSICNLVAVYENMVSNPGPIPS